MQLLEHFKELTLHPKNADELKGLILQLAVQGKLTNKWREDNPDTDSATILLGKIEAEKAKLIKAKKIKKEKLEPVSSDEFYFDVPDNWDWERLGNIGFIFNGDSINKSVKEAKYADLESGHPYIGTKDVGYIFDSIDHENGVKIPFDDPKFKVVREGTVLICSEGGSAGKKMGIVNQESCFGNKLYAIEQYGEIESIYILALYGSRSFSEAFKENMTGIIGGISRNSFANLCIPLPPLEEQKAIVSIVNQLFKEVEELELLTKARIQLKEDFVTSALQQLANGDTATEWAFLQPHFQTFFTEKSAVKKLRESILQLAVQGKLTRAFRESHPELVSGSHSAKALLKKIKAEKALLIKEKKIKAEKPLPEITEEDIPYPSPEGWEWCGMQDLCDPFTIITYGILKPVWIEQGGVPTVRIKDMKKGGILLHEIALCDTERASKFSKTTLCEGDLLIAKDGGTLGKTAIVPKILAGGNITQHVLRFSVNKELSNLFVRAIVDSPFGQAYMKGETKGAALPGVNVGDFRKMIVAIPGLEEQKAILAKVNALMGLCDSLEKEIEQNTQQLEGLMQSCLREVFEG